MWKSRQHGFTMIELVSTTVVVGILSAVAALAYSKSVEDAHQKEAAYVLNLIRNAENRYFAYEKKYGELSDLDIEAPSSPYFEYNVELFDGTNDFIATAIPQNSPQSQYEMTITKDGHIEEIVVAIAQDDVLVEEEPMAENPPYDPGPTDGGFVEEPPMEIIPVIAGNDPTPSPTPPTRVVNPR